ncbi:MAG: hypothetical protein J6W23_10835, partial [Victivallales bacterium]|nr:hypothetical protein [Victivallales bacterium]
IGKDIRVLLEQREDDKNWIARSVADAPEVDNVLYVSVKNKRSEDPRFTNVRITNTGEYECEAKEI